ncbi:MAG: ABC transporter ATP-binding protein [Terrimicrobiaceae bacterium]
MPVITTEGLSKRYRLGVINRRYLYKDMQSFFARCLGRPDPHSEVDARVTHTREGIIWALNDVSIEIKDGDVVGVIGRNGSGKSTLLKILSRITTPTKGTARIKGRVASLLEVGTGFHPELTGRDNVYLNGSILGMPRDMIRAKFDEIVAFSGVEEFIDTPVKRYSSGMKVRLAFAVAAHLEPDILIVDEVLAVGDAEFQKKCLGKIGDAAKSGRTVLFVSHNAAAVENLCTKGIVLNNGQVQFTGTQTEAIQFYGNSTETHAEPIHARKDRRGSGEIKIVDIILRDMDGTRTSTFTPGSSLSLEMHYKRQPDRVFPHLIVGMTIKSHLEVPIFHIDNNITGDSLGNLAGDAGFFTCVLNNLPLMPGIYRIDYRLLSQAKGARILDFLEGALEFEVQENNFFGTGKLPPFGLIITPAKWIQGTK